MRFVRALLVPWMLSSSLAACAGRLCHGESQFDEGQYPAAKETFAGLEAQSREWDSSRQAQYALFRGLTHAALGDRAKAGVWLRGAKAIEEAHPGSLSPIDVRRLKVGLEALD
jgi:hypothetical protein